MKQYSGSYEKDTNIQFDNLIIESIFESTEGAQGLTAMYAEELTRCVAYKNKSPNIGEWLDHVNSSKFIDHICNQANYKQVTRVLERHGMIDKLLKEIGCKTKLTARDIDELLGANILRVNDDEGEEP